MVLSLTAAQIIFMSEKTHLPSLAAYVYPLPCIPSSMDVTQSGHGDAAAGTDQKAAAVALACGT